MQIILFGPPGSGKGTQAEKLSKLLKLEHLSTGDILRSAVSAKTTIGMQAKKIMEEGKLVSDEIVLSIVNSRILENDCKRGFILDGFPRTLVQAKALDSTLELENRKIDNVVEIQVDEETVVERIIGRFSCKNCGSNYHEKLKPTKKNGICDTCGATEFTIRKDDSKDIVENRFKSYNEDTGPLIPYYKKKNLLCEINGMNSIEKVYEDIKKELDVY
ncbi:adenylate kinase [Alphaproteobacteria bacterium]|nr:adenylate kinase [Alphaproteobacteria bacterium]